jgi:hypothetical protein
MDSDPDPKQEMHLIKNPQKSSNLIIKTLKLGRKWDPNPDPKK